MQPRTHPITVRECTQDAGHCRQRRHANQGAPPAVRVGNRTPHVGPEYVACDRHRRDAQRAQNESKRSGGSSEAGLAPMNTTLETSDSWPGERFQSQPTCTAANSIRARCYTPLASALVFSLHPDGEVEKRLSGAM